MWAYVAGCLVPGSRVVGWPRSERSWFDFLELAAMRGFARCWHRCRVERPAALPSRGPALIVANHPSQADPAFLLSGCPRPIHFLQAREYYAVPLLRRLFDWAGCIPVARGGRDVRALRAALQQLKEGAVVGLFPEGDISPAEGGQRRGQTGVALLALRSRAPVYPARLQGGPRGRDVLTAWLWPSSGVRVCFGDPVDLTPYYDQPLTHHLLREVTDLLMARVAALRPDADDVSR